MGLRGTHSGFHTGLYELTMAGYFQNYFPARAIFEFFVRHLPPKASASYATRDPGTIAVARRRLLTTAQALALVTPGALSA